jgi:hypothetical protein
MLMHPAMRMTLDGPADCDLHNQPQLTNTNQHLASAKGLVKRRASSRMNPNPNCFSRNRALQRTREGRRLLILLYQRLWKIW